MKNDRGKMVIPVGAPGSPARVKAEFPALLDRLNAIHAGEGALADAVDEIRSAGIIDRMTTRSLLESCRFRDEPTLEVY